MGKDCRARVLDGYTLGHMIKTLEDEFLAIEGGRGLEKRLETAKALSFLGNLADDYLTIYNEYESIQGEFGGAHKLFQYLKDILTLKRSPLAVFREIKGRKNHPIVAKLALKAKATFRVLLLRWRI
jgi:hypothetical protein